MLIAPRQGKYKKYKTVVWQANNSLVFGVGFSWVICYPVGRLYEFVWYKKMAVMAL